MYSRRTESLELMSYLSLGIAFVNTMILCVMLLVILK